MRKLFLLLSFVFFSLYSFSQFNKEKAELTFKLIQYFEWHGKNSSDNVLRVGVYGSYEMYRELADVLIGETMNGQNFDAVYISKEKDITLVEYDVIYISKQFCSPAKLKEITTLLDGRGSVLIGETKRSIANGADISFFVVNNELHAEYSFHKCVAKELKIGSRLDAVAMRVN